MNGVLEMMIWKFLAVISPIYGATDTSVLGFRARMDHFLACFITCVILRFTSGATSADQLVVSMTAKQFNPHTCTCVHGGT